jgi:hypothetical protein
MRTFYYRVKENAFNSEKRYHLYIWADRRFSLYEMLAKQHNILNHLYEIFQEDVEIKLASCRESNSVIIKFNFSTSAFHADIVEIKHSKKEIFFDYENVLEFVLTDSRHIDKLLEWLKSKWKGEWIEWQEVNK